MLRRNELVSVVNAVLLKHLKHPYHDLSKEIVEAVLAHIGRR
jgi:hypothetical protein